MLAEKFINVESDSRDEGAIYIMFPAQSLCPNRTHYNSGGPALWWLFWIWDLEKSNKHKIHESAWYVGRMSVSQNTRLRMMIVFIILLNTYVRINLIWTPPKRRARNAKLVDNWRPASSHRSEWQTCFMIAILIVGCLRNGSVRDLYMDRGIFHFSLIAVTEKSSFEIEFARRHGRS